MLRSSSTWVGALAVLALSVGAFASCGERFESAGETTTTSPTGVAGQGGGTAGTAGTGGGPAGGAGGGGVSPEGCGPPATVTAEGWCLLADEQNFPECPIGDATHIYWTVTGGVWRVDKAGLALPERVSSAAGDNRCIITHDGRLWWANETHNLIHRASKLGLNAQAFPTLGAERPSHLAGDDDHIYWTGADDGTGLLAGAVARRLKDGTGVVEVLAAGLDTPSGIAVDDTYVYWKDEEGIRRCEKEDCSPHTLTPAIGDSSGDLAVVVVTNDSVLWNYKHGIGRVAKTGGVGQSLQSGFELTAGLALADGFAYFADHAHVGGIHRAALNGAQHHTVAAPIDAPLGVVVDDVAVYWVTAPGGEAPSQVLKGPIPPWR